MDKQKQINAAIQLLPIGAGNTKYQLIDAAIATIKASGLHFKVCPFETVVEGPSDKVYALIQHIQEQTLGSDCPEILINIKIHAATRDLGFAEKLEKY
ncbi:MAG: thiamine-binding protein [bacterium]|nr:thiamine-binding protein [bacterium]